MSPPLLGAIAGAAEGALRALPWPSTAGHQSAVTAVTDHRSDAPPGEAWQMAQSWIDLLFAHWRVAPEVLRQAVPPELPIDTFDGSAWLGVTPFRVGGFRLRGMPPLPVVSRFLEVNVRTYVTVGGRPGVYFFSLDASNGFAVEAARRLYRLPYFRADIGASQVRDATRFESRRRGDERSANLRITYTPSGPVARAQPGTLERFLAERYRLYTVDDDRRVLVAEIHHPPWPLQAAEATVFENTMAEPLGVPLEGEPLLHYAARQDVLFWPPQPAEAFPPVTAGVA